MQLEFTIDNVFNTHSVISRGPAAIPVFQGSLVFTLFLRQPLPDLAHEFTLNDPCTSYMCNNIKYKQSFIKDKDECLKGL